MKKLNAKIIVFLLVIAVAMVIFQFIHKPQTRLEPNPNITTNLSQIEYEPNLNMTFLEIYEKYYPTRNYSMIPSRELLISAFNRDASNKTQMITKIYLLFALLDRYGYPYNASDYDYLVFGTIDEYLNNTNVSDTELIEASSIWSYLRKKPDFINQEKKNQILQKYLSDFSKNINSTNVDYVSTGYNLLFYLYTVQDLKTYENQSLRIVCPYYQDIIKGRNYFDAPIGIMEFNFLRKSFVCKHLCHLNYTEQENLLLNKMKTDQPQSIVFYQNEFKLIEKQ